MSSTERNPCLVAALEELAKAGIRSPVIANGAKHLQLRWSTPRGEVRMMAVCGIHSDRRAPDNTRRDVRRILRDDGMLEVSEPRSEPVKQASRIDLLERRLTEVERQLGTILNGMSGRQLTTLRSESTAAAGD